MSADGGASLPSAADLVAAARAMIPTLGARAQKQSEYRRLLPETVAEMKEAGFFRVLQPKRWGG
jgi:3-hydroxy-9,10-secoandrosta-1,3,5(10)-triene-9,17-dione monooxygenase